MNPKEIEPQAWQDFDEWARLNDPNGNLSTEQRIDRYFQDFKWHSKPLKRPGVEANMELLVTDESAPDLNSLIRHVAGPQQPVKPGDKRMMVFNLHMTLDEIIPTNGGRPATLLLVDYLLKHPTSMKMRDSEKEAILHHLDRAVKHAQLWTAFVNETASGFARLFAKQELAKKKNTNKVVIE